MLKTLKRKIALVAVAALGASFLSIASAQAASAGALSIRTDTGGAGVGTTTSLYVGAPYIARQLDADMVAGTAAMTLSHANAGAGVVSNKVGATGSQEVQVVFTTAGLSGVLTSAYNDGAADGQTLAGVSISAAPTLTATVGPARVNSGQTIDVKVTGTGTVVTAVQFKYANISKPTGAADLVLTDTLTGADVNLGTATTATTVGTLAAPNAAGTYTGVVYQDTNINGTVDPGEPSSFVSITTAGAPASATLTPATDSEALSTDGEFTVTLKDANGNTTQAAVGEFFSLVADPTSGASNVTLGGNGLSSPVNGTAGANATAVIPFNVLGDGEEAFTVRSNTAGDSVAISLASSGALRAQGVAASLTATLNVVAASAVNGSAAATTSTRLALDATNTVAASAAAAGLNAYIADPSLKTATFTITGVNANKAITFTITATDGNTSFTNLMKLGINGATAAAYTSGASVSAVADATGTITLAWSTTGTLTTGVDVIDLDLNAGTTDVVATQTNARITWADPAYAVKLTAPSSTVLLVTKTSTVLFEGTLIDQFGNPLQGAVVSISGAQTGTATVAALTASTTSDAAGKWSVTMAAPATTTSQVTATVTATRTGASFTNNGAQYTINYTASGDATSLTYTASPANTTAADGVTIATNPATLTPHDGVVSIAGGVQLSNANYTLATATSDAAATDPSSGLDEYFTIIPTSTPAAEVTFTSDDSVWFTAGSTSVAATTASATVFNKTGKFASGSTVKIWSTKAGKHTVTMAVGATTKTQDFWTSAAPVSARNIAVSAPATAKQGEIGRLTITVTDNWGNPVKGVAVGTISATVKGQGTLGGGKITDTFGATDAAGQAILAFTAGTADSTLEFTIDAADVGYQFSSRAGRAGYVATQITDGTIAALTKSEIAPAVKTVVSGSNAAAASNPEVAAVKADVKAVSDTVATLSKAVTTIQSSVTELTSSFSAQIKSLSSAIAKISRAIAALSKRIK